MGTPYSCQDVQVLVEYANGSAATRTVQLVHIYIYHMYFGSRLKRLEKVRFPFRRYAAYGPSVIASNFAD